MKEKLISDLNEMLANSTTLKWIERRLIELTIEYIENIGGQTLGKK